MVLAALVGLLILGGIRSIARVTKTMVPFRRGLGGVGAACRSTGVASMGLGPVIDFSDAMIFAMALANVVGLYVLLPVVREEVRRYEAGVASGAIRRR